MIACDTCGALVDPGMLQTHVDWHEEVVTYTNLGQWADLEEANSETANPERTRR